jgi:hypothetical protein
MSGRLEHVAAIIGAHTGAAAWINVLREIARENDNRRAKSGGEVYWTWDQWDRFIACAEEAHVVDAGTNPFVAAMYHMRRRAQRAKADGLSAWQFHLAMGHVIDKLSERYSRAEAHTRDMEARARGSEFQRLVAENLVKERARAEARRIVAAENPRPTSRATRRPPPPEE